MHKGELRTQENTEPAEVWHLLSSWTRVLWLWYYAVVHVMKTLKLKTEKWNSSYSLK